MAVTSVVEKWVDSVAGLTRPDRTVWCDGSKAEYDGLVELMLRDGTLLALNQATYPGCYLHRSHPSDVARTEQLTFICSAAKDDAGPTNNWMAPAEAKAKARPYFDGAMRGRTMYVIPYLMGPAGSPMSRVGVMVTDSAYVVASMHLMTRVGQVAIQHMRSDDDFIAGLHSLGDLSPDRRLILHFPEEKLIWSVGSGYGGNALLGKKCHALRIGSFQARQEGWLAEHMLILGVEDPDGQVTYLAAAMPSASGKTNLAMVVSQLPGYRVWTLGDDIAWIHVDKHGQLRAINPERGFFGVAPNTSPKTNPSAHRHGPLEHDLHQCRDDAVRGAVVGRVDRDAARGPHRLAGQALAARSGPRRASQLALHRAGLTVPVHRAQLGGSRGRADLRVHLRLAADAGDPAGLRGLRLAARRLPRLGHEHGDHRGDHRPGGRGAARPHGHAPVLRLQHGRLLQPLARDAVAAQADAQDLPRELVPQGRRGPLPVAGVWRKRPDLEVDRRAGSAARPRPSRRRSAGSRRRARSTSRASTSHPPSSTPPSR